MGNERGPEELKRLLKDVKAQHLRNQGDREKASNLSENVSEDDPFAKIKRDRQTNRSASPKDSAKASELLKQVKAQKTKAGEKKLSDTDYFSGLRSQHLKKQQKQGSNTQDNSLHQTVEEIRTQERSQQQQRKQAIASAEQWLEDLEPYSQEGLWFSELAKYYSSKLDAAIDYLGALEHPQS